MCSLVTKKDYNKEMQLQQSFYIGYIEYARNITLPSNKRYLNAVENQEKKNKRSINSINVI